MHFYMHSYVEKKFILVKSGCYRKSLNGAPVQPPMVDRLTSVWFYTLSALQAKSRCPLNGLAPWVSPSPSAMGRCASIWSYCLVHVLGDVNYYLPH
jgi:hypothetical protein